MAIINNSINNTLQTPFKLGAVSVTSTGTQLNYLNAASGTTGTGSVVFATAPTLSALTVTANSTSNNFISAGFTTVSSGTLITLTSASPKVQRITGSSTQTIQLPAANTLSLSWAFEINNNSSGVVTVNDGAAGFLFTIPGGGYAVVFCIASFTVAGAWDWHFEVPANVQWGTSGLVGYAKSGANSDITSLTGLNGVIQAPTQINDANGNKVVTFGASASAVNYLEIANGASGSGATLSAKGTDTNVQLSLVAQGTGLVALYTTATSNQIDFVTGTGYNHQSTFNFPNSANNRLYTFQDANGTLCMDTSSSGSLTTAPPVSASSTLAVGTAYQNTLGYDIVLTVYLSVTAATTASILLGVGTTTTPTQQTIVSSLTTASTLIVPVTIYLPNNYYAKLSTSGTITQTISGQQAMAV